MTDSDKSGNIFKIMDEIIFQLNKTKKMFIIMILTIMIIPPVALLFTSVIFDPPFEEQEEKTQRDGPKPKFVIYRVIPLIISAVWLGIGIRQWIVLSKWTKKYDRYKKLQEKIDRKLDDDEQQNDSSNK
jgi:NADH:ubiquinone oxidoreductase subunit 5 (subunit L)/multisubunit Na+/H+ antiporter MnhA subunit